MPAYQNNGGNSNVVAWDEGPDWIEVEFAGGRWTTYLYTAASCGQSAVDTMKRLAAAGQGLNSYIVRNVGTAYASKR